MSMNRKSAHSNTGKKCSARPWEDNFRRLVEYKKRHGHTKVPRPYPRDPSLANWVHTQRLSRNQNNAVSEDRVERLNSIGFVWRVEQAKSDASRGHPKKRDPAHDPRQYVSGRTKDKDKQWNRFFRELKEFRQLHGHFRVPKSCADLYAWMEYQRQTCRDNTIWLDRKELLDSIGFDFEDGVGDFYKCFKQEEEEEEEEEEDSEEESNSDNVVSETDSSDNKKMSPSSKHQRAKMPRASNGSGKTASVSVDEPEPARVLSTLSNPQEGQRNLTAGATGTSRLENRATVPSPNNATNGFSSGHQPQQGLANSYVSMLLHQEQQPHQQQEPRRAQIPPRKMTEDEAWHYKYSTLKRIRRQCGHFPSAKHFQLWMNDQRRRFRENTLQEDRKKLLLEVGFDFLHVASSRALQSTEMAKNRRRGSSSSDFRDDKKLSSAKENASSAPRGESNESSLAYSTDSRDKTEGGSAEDRRPGKGEKRPAALHESQQSKAKKARPPEGAADNTSPVGTSATKESPTACNPNSTHDYIESVTNSPPHDTIPSERENSKIEAIDIPKLRDLLIDKIACSTDSRVVTKATFSLVNSLRASQQTCREVLGLEARIILITTMKKWSDKKHIQSECILAIQELIRQLKDETDIKLAFIKLGAVDGIALALKNAAGPSDLRLLLSGMKALADLFSDDDARESGPLKVARLSAATAFVEKLNGIQFVSDALTTFLDNEEVQVAGCVLLSQLSGLGDFQNVMKQAKVRSVLAHAAETHENNTGIQDETSKLYLYMCTPAPAKN